MAQPMTAPLVCTVAPVEAVLRLAQRYPVFPCRRHPEEITVRGERKLRKPKSPLVERGLHDATQDADRIRAWWRQWPDALVGVPTGKTTGLVVVDYDHDKAAPETRQWIADHTDSLLQTRSHSTLSGGRHYLFRLPQGGEYKNGVGLRLNGQELPGLDLRGEGGYIIWWPLHGGQSTGELAPLPVGLVDEYRIEHRELAPLPKGSPQEWARQRQQVGEALAYVSPENYETWRNVGMAIHLASGGNDDGFDLWHAWSAGGLTGDAPHNYSGINDCRYHWASYNQDANRERNKIATLGTLFHLAKEAGWTRRKPDLEPPPVDLPPIEVYHDDPATSPGLGDETVDKTDKPPKRRPIRWGDLQELTPPERQWAIPHWLGIGYVTLIAGPGGVGKSLLAQQIGAALSVGDTFIEPAERPLRVLMWAGEDSDDELWRRQLCIAGEAGRELHEYATNFFVESYEGRDCSLAEMVYNALAPTPMLKELEEQAADYDADVILLDNIARLYGGSENDRHQVTQFVNWVSGACNRHKRTAVGLLGHPSKVAGSEWSGSTAWEAAVRSRWYFGRTLPDQKDEEGADADPDVRYLARRKSNYSGLDTLRLRYDQIRHLLRIDADAGTPERGLHPMRAEAMVVEALAQFARMQVATSDEKRNPQFLPRVMVDRKLADRSQIRALADALYRLMKAGKVVRKQVGTYANRTPRMGLGLSA